MFPSDSFFLDELFVLFRLCWQDILKVGAEESSSKGDRDRDSRRRGAV